MTRSRDDIERLERLLDGIEEVIAVMPQDGLTEAERRQEIADGRRAKEIIFNHLAQFKRKRRERLADDFARAKATRSTKVIDIPSDPQERRSVFASLIANHPEQIPNGMTMAFRDGRELTDAEIVSILTAWARLATTNGGPQK